MRSSDKSFRDHAFIDIGLDNKSNALNHENWSNKAGIIDVWGDKVLTAKKGIDLIEKAFVFDNKQETIPLILIIVNLMILK